MGLQRRVHPGGAEPGNDVDSDVEGLEVPVTQVRTAHPTFPCPFDQVRDDHQEHEEEGVQQEHAGEEEDQGHMVQLVLGRLCLEELNEGGQCGQSCESEQTIFSHTTHIIKCRTCGENLAEPTGGKAKINGRIIAILG